MKVYCSLCFSVLNCQCYRQNGKIKLDKWKFPKPQNKDENKTVRIGVILTLTHLGKYGLKQFFFSEHESQLLTNFISWTIFLFETLFDILKYVLICLRFLPQYFSSATDKSLFILLHINNVTTTATNLWDSSWVGPILHCTFILRGVVLVC